MENQIDGEEIELEESLGVGEQEEEEEEADESWNGGRLEENLEKLLEKYANLANDGQTSDDDENDTTDYYSMKIGGRPMPFTLIENENNTQVKNPKEDVLVEKRSIGTITNTIRNEEHSVQMINKRSANTANTANKFEASLVETRKELDQSAISTTSTQLSKASLNKIYTELNDIHQRLFNEYNIFKRKEKLLKQKELKLKHNEEYLTLVNNELDSKLKFEEIKSKYDQQLSTIREDIRSKVKENKRLYHAFKSIRDSNESLRLKLSQTQEKMAQMERQNSSLNGRLFSLLKKIENENKSETAVLEQKPSPPQTTSTEQQTKSLKKQTSQLKVSQISTLEALANSLEWINETSLRRLDFNLPLAGNESASTTTTTKQLEKIQRILPTVSQYIQAFNSSLSSSSSALVDSTLVYYKRYALVFLEFAYLSLLHADVAYQNQKVNLSATFRHIGEEVYKCLLAYRASKSTNYFRPVKEDDKREMATADADHQTINGIGIGATTLASVSCDNKHARILSCLIVLKTLNQVDVLVNVFELLRDDLVDEESKQTFLDLHGTWTVLKFCRLNNHTLLDLAVDIYLQLSMVDSVGGNKQQSDRFIATCSNEYWFSQIALIFRNSNVTSSGSSSIGLLTTSSTNAFLDLKVVEKLCILLQKLSKIRSNRKYFEMFSLNKICSNLLQRFHTESNFLSMNLKSIISNLNGEQIK